MKQIFKPSSKIKIEYVVREADRVVNRYDISNEKAGHVKGWKLLIEHPWDRCKNNLSLMMSSFQLEEIDAEEFLGKDYFS